MYCENCGAQIQDDSAFCVKCGAKVEPESTGQSNGQGTEPGAGQGMGQNAGQSAQWNPEAVPPVNKVSSEFIEPDEMMQTSLGEGYLHSFLMGRKIKRCVSIVSNKRVYLYGDFIDINTGAMAKVSRQKKEKIVDLEDITGTGFIYTSPGIGKLLSGIVFLIGAIVLFAVGFEDGEEYLMGGGAAALFTSVMLFVSYIKNRKTRFSIEYAGGCINFNTSIYGVKESTDYHRQLRRAITNRKEQLYGKKES